MRSRSFALLLSLSLARCSQGPSNPDGSSQDAASEIATDAIIADAVSSGDASARDASAGDADASPMDAPITAPNEEWTFVPIEGMRCGNGSDTGVGVNLTRRSSKVLVIFAGGGACWDGVTCFTLRTAANIDGYTAASFAAERNGLASSPMLDRADANNPFRDASFVYIPYCTGDLHSGHVAQLYDVQGARREMRHWGAANVEALLPRLRATFTSLEPVWLYGLSAGGYGAVFNWWRFKREFLNVHVASDCGVFATPPGSRYSDWMAAWLSQMPPDCLDCATNLTSVLTTQLARFRADRFAQLAYTNDMVLSTYYGISGAEFGTMVSALNTRLAMESNARTFIVTGTNHVMAGGYSSIRSSDGTALSAWLSQWATGAIGWASRTPY
ncbi:MAG: pectin acetylesterase-family hydrolase [Polyangiales bacterium]